MSTGVVSGQHAHVCLTCFNSYPLAAPETELKLPGLDPGPQHRKSDESESMLVTRIVRALNACGYLAQRVGQYRADRAGNDKGVADLLVRHPYWGRGLCMQMEVKLPGAPVPSHQQALCDAGVTIIIRSPEEAVAAARAMSSLIE